MLGLGVFRLGFLLRLTRRLVVVLGFRLFVISAVGLLEILTLTLVLATSASLRLVGGLRSVHSSSSSLVLEVSLLVSFGLIPLLLLLKKLSLGLLSELLDFHWASLVLFEELLPVRISVVKHVHDEHLDSGRKLGLTLIRDNLLEPSKRSLNFG